MSRPEPIVVIDSSEILDGKLSEVETVIKEMAAFVESNEPRPISYNVYLNEDGTRMTVVQVHPDSASMEFHMKVAAPAFAKFAELIRLSTMDVYGKPSDELLEQMQQKVEMLGSATVTVHELHAGFDRFGFR
jgi:quinol monooxygenase YgiN